MANITTTFSGDTRQLNRAIAQVNSNVIQLTNRMQSQGTRAGQGYAQGFRQQTPQIQSAIRNAINPANLKGDLVRLSGAIAAAFSAREVVSAADSYKRFTSSLAVAGVAGANLANVQKELFDLAQQNGTALEPLGQLYGRIASSAKELGASQADILQVTAAVGAAIRISGQSAEAASGAMLQMGQALGAGTVRAEEFNSMAEGLMPLLQGAADASTKYGGSVAKMRADVLEGKLSSAEFLEMIKASTDELEGRAAQAPLTFANSLQVLKNAFTQAIGQTDSMLGATDRLAQAVVLVANSLDTIIGAITVLAVALGSRYAAAALAAGVSTARLTAFQASMTASMTGSTVGAVRLAGAMGVLRTSSAGVLAMFGGPLGLAITAVALALGSLAMDGMAASAAMDATKEASTAAKQGLENYSEQARRAGIAAQENTVAANASGNAMAGAGSKAAGAVGGLRAYAAAQREAAYADIMRERTAAVIRRDNAQARTRGARSQDRGMVGSISEGWNRLTTDVSAITADFLTNGKSERDLQNQIATDNATIKALDAQSNLMTTDKFWEAQYKAQRPTTASTGGSKSGGGSSAKPIDYEANDAKALHDANMIRLAMTISGTENMRLRHELEDRQATEMQKAAIEVIKANDQLSAAGKTAAVEALQGAHLQENANRLREQQVAILEQTQQAEKEAVQAANDLQAIEEGRLSILASIAQTESERWKLEDQATKTRRERERALRQSEEAQIRAQAAITADLEKKAQLTRQADALAAQGRAQEGVYQAEDQSTARDRRSTLQTYMDGLKNDSTFKGGDAMVNALKAFEDGMMGVIDKSKTLKDVVADMAMSVIADFARMQIKALILRAVMAFLPGGGGGASIGGDSGGLLPGALSGAPTWKPRAIGDKHTTNGFYKINEGGTEGVILPNGSEIIPAGDMKGMAKASAPRSANQNFHFTTTVNATDSVVYSQMLDTIRQSQVESVHAAKAMTMRQLGDDQRRAIRPRRR